MNTHPPAWAQSLLSLLVSSRHRDGILGDLLEEYRESQVPARDVPAADRWYVRQVVGFLWRAACWWGLALGAMMVVRAVFDILVPTQDYYTRSAWTTYSAVAVFVACGLRSGWYYGRVLSGTIVAIAAASIASAIALASPLLFLGWLRVSQQIVPFGTWEALDVPVPILLIFGAVLGSLGAALGSVAGRRGPRRATPAS